MGFAGSGIGADPHGASGVGGHVLQPIGFGKGVLDGVEGVAHGAMRRLPRHFRRAHSADPGQVRIVVVVVGEVRAA